MSVQTSEVKETMDTPSSEGLIVHLDVSILFIISIRLRRQAFTAPRPATRIDN
jgi:hypothetical protein